MSKWNCRSPKLCQRRILFEQIEGRIVLDAAVAPQLATVLSCHPRYTHLHHHVHHDSLAKLTTQPVDAPPYPASSPTSRVFNSGKLDFVLISNTLGKILGISQAIPTGNTVITYDSQHGNPGTIAPDLSAFSDAQGHKTYHLKRFNYL